MAARYQARSGSAPRMPTNTGHTLHHPKSGHFSTLCNSHFMQLYVWGVSRFGLLGTSNKTQRQVPYSRYSTCKKVSGVLRPVELTSQLYLLRNRQKVSVDTPLYDSNCLDGAHCRQVSAFFDKRTISLQGTDMVSLSMKLHSYCHKIFGPPKYLDTPSML